MENLEMWLGALSAIGAVVMFFYQRWDEMRDAREHRDKAVVLEVIHELGPKIVLAVERVTEATPTKKDDEALARLKKAVEAVGKKIPPEMLAYAKEFLGGAYQEYKVNVLGIPAHMDGADAKKAIAEKALAEEDPSSQPGDA